MTPVQMHSLQARLRLFEQPGVRARIVGVVFGVVLMMMAALSMFFPMVVLLRVLDPSILSTGINNTPASIDASLILFMALFFPMSVVVLSAAWNMFVYAATGRRQALFHAGSLRLFMWVMRVSIGIGFVLALSDGSFEDASYFLVSGAWLDVFFRGALRVQAKRETSAADGGASMTRPRKMRW